MKFIWVTMIALDYCTFGLQAVNDAQNVRVDTTGSDGIKLKLIPCTRKLSHFSRGHVGAFFAVEGVRDCQCGRVSRINDSNDRK